MPSRSKARDLRENEIPPDIWVLTDPRNSGQSASATQKQTPTNTDTDMGPIGMPELVVILIVAIFVALVGVLPFWFICKKTGLSPWLSVIMIVPFGGFVLPFLLAFIDWPALKEPKAGQNR
jgi:hypothetical protein